MQEFINKYRDQINGTLSGFDRLVFRGLLRRLNYGYWDHDLQSVVAQGMEQYLWQNHILFKDYLDHVKHVSQQVKQASIKPFVTASLPEPFLVCHALAGQCVGQIVGKPSQGKCCNSV